MVLKAVQKQIQSKQQESPTSSKAEKGRSKLFGSKKPTTQAETAVEEDEEAEEVQAPKPADKGRARLFGKTPPTTSVKDEADQLSEDLDNKIKPSKRSNRAEFRKMVENQAKSNITEDWDAKRITLPVVGDFNSFGVSPSRVKLVVEATGVAVFAGVSLASFLLSGII